MLWWVLDDGVTTTRFRRTRRAQGFDRRRRLLPEVSGRGNWRGTGDGELRSHDDCIDSLWLLRGKGVREMRQREGKRLGGEVESANFVSLRFCVLDNNIRNFKCALSCAGFTAQELPGRIIRPGAG
jgi:hypothetical protein